MSNATEWFHKPGEPTICQPEAGNPEDAGLIPFSEILADLEELVAEYKLNKSKRKK